MEKQSRVASDFEFVSRFAATDARSACDATAAEAEAVLISAEVRGVSDGDSRPAVEAAAAQATPAAAEAKVSAADASPPRAPPASLSPVRAAASLGRATLGVKTGGLLVVVCVNSASGRSEREAISPLLERFARTNQI